MVRGSAESRAYAASVLATDHLWGGRVLAVSFDPVAWTLSVDVETVNDGEEHQYRLVLDDVSSWQVSRDIALPWTYAELTEIEVSELDDGRVFVEMVLWNDDTSFMAWCSRVRVDDVS